MPTEILPLLQTWGINALVTEPWDKLGHFVWYAAITLLLCHITRNRLPMAVLLSVAAFGALDEICQSFVPERSADIVDFIVNASASALTVTFARKYLPCAESSAP